MEYSKKDSETLCNILKKLLGCKSSITIQEVIRGRHVNFLLYCESCYIGKVVAGNNDRYSFNIASFESDCDDVMEILRASQRLWDYINEHKPSTDIERWNNARSS
jgi:hypothetical protein